MKVNPNAYIAAEVTNEGELFDIGNGNASRFGRGDITRKLLNETGMTATANYSSFFTDTIMMFGKKFEYDKGSMEYSIDDHFQNCMGASLFKLSCVFKNMVRRELAI